jgi:alkylhydroperoxidase/carboxymuconolactone decarboxylase family protein YurZ
MTTNQTEQDRILARVAKMLNLAANDGATEGERDNALRMAHATLAKYNLDISQATITLHGKKGVTTEPREKSDELYLGVMWARQIAFAVGKLFFCHYHYSKVPRNQHKARHIFIGNHANVVTAQGMAKYLVSSVHREAQRYSNAAGGDYSAYRSFATAAMVRIAARCEALRREAMDKTPKSSATPGMALALSDVYQNELEANRRHLVALGVALTTRKQSAKGAFDHDAARAGSAYGATVSLNRQLA